MKRTIKIQTLLLLAFFMSLPFALLSQEEVKEEKKVRIKTVKEVDGRKIIRDTTFTVSGDEDVKEIVKEFTFEVDGDSSGIATINVMVDVDVDDDSDIDWSTDKKKKVIVISSPHGHKKVIKFKSGDGDDEEVIIISPHGKHRVIKLVGEDGEEYEYDFDFDFDISMRKFHHEMDELKDHMKEMHIEIFEDKDRMYEEIMELKALKELDDFEELKELDDLEELKEMDFYVMPPPPPAPREPYFYRDFNRKDHHRMEVTDKELRDAGVKNKPDRLEPDEININNDDGVVDLSFSLKEEGSPKVIAYNIYGDKVFSGKPALLNDKYELKIDLSKKQHGTYYLMIVVGNSSKTMRIRN